MNEIDLDLSELHARIDEWIAEGYYNGASLEIATTERVLYRRSYGHHTSETVEYIASSGKWLAAATIMALVDDGVLSLEDTASKWLPEFTDAKGRATLRQMLAHTSGYPDYQPKENPPDKYQTLAESVKHLVPLTPDNNPGKRWNYGGLAMQAAGRMAEVAARMDWEVIFQQKIALPLGMKQTSFTPVDSGFGHSPMLGGSARSSLSDFAKFLTMVANKGIYKERRVLSEKAIAEMCADQVRTARVNPENFVSSSRGTLHHGVYGLGVWREREDSTGSATLVSSPSWAGTYPWIDLQRNVFGVFVAHVNVDVAKMDAFDAMKSAAELPILVGISLDKSRQRNSS